MKRALITAIALCSIGFAVAGCLKVGDTEILPTLPPITSSQPPTVENVQSAVSVLCQVAITTTSIAKLLTSNRAVQTAGDWAKSICGAVQTAPASDGPTGREKPIVRLNGVRLHGTLPDGRKF